MDVEEKTNHGKKIDKQEKEGMASLSEWDTNERSIDTSLGDELLEREFARNEAARKLVGGHEEETSE